MHAMPAKGPRRVLASLLVSSLLVIPAFGQDLTGTFNEGVDLLKRGDDAGALAKFQAVLAMDPGHDAAYELFRATEHEIWVEMLVKEGEFELVAKRLMGLAEIGRKERRDDEEAIRALLAELNTNDVMTRVRTTRTLASDHGEYAVPLMIHALADPDNDDRRVIFMRALTDMGDDVVLPLVAALGTPDAFQRRNVALTLGYIGDPRANGALAALATGDPDAGVQAAASEALARTGGNDNAVGQLLELGNAYHAASPSVLRPHQYSDVVWSWSGNGLVATEVPTFLYNEELAKQSFYHALRLAPGSTEALAGIARASVSEHEQLSERAAAGQDVGDWADRLADDDLAIQVAGTPALDMALLWALEQGDHTAASGLCRALGASATSPTQGLLRALRSEGAGAIRGEAAVALGHIAVHGNTSASGDVVAALAEAASRRVMQIAAIIDADASRSANLAQALSSRGVLVNDWNTGAKGLAGLRRIPGVDVVLVAESLPDLTFHQVVTEVKADSRTANAPVLILAADADSAMETWGDHAADALAGPADIAKVEAALEGGMNADRDEANALAGRAATALAHLAAAGTSDVASAADALAGALDGRPDNVVTPALGALGHAGGPRHAGAAAAVLADGSRSDEARIAAGNALAGIFSRSPQGAGEETLAALHGVVTDGANSLAVRRSAATALGRLDLSPEMRQEILEAVRANVAGQ